MKRAVLLILLAVILAATVVLAQIPTKVTVYSSKPGKALKVNIPQINLSAKQTADLKAKKPVCLLLDSPTNPDLKAGYMRVILPYDPVTVWWIVRDIKHFPLVDPMYPKTGSLTSKRRTFMPYTFDTSVCKVNGKQYMYQLMVMPFVAPRKFSLNRFGDRNGFPWESAWTAADQMYCADGRNKQLDSYYNDAVQMPYNDGCWHIQPVPQALRTKPDDALLAFVEYYVDSNPGGNLGAVKAVVNKATSVALPTLHKNMLLHGKTWKEHLQKYHSVADQQLFAAEQAAFRQEMGF